MNARGFAGLRPKASRPLAMIGLLAIIAFGSAACEHPIGILTPHIEAADLLVVDSTGSLLARTDFNRRWNVDSLVVRDGQSLRIVLIPIDFRGDVIDITERRDLSFRMEAEHGEMLQWEPQRGFGWIHAFGTGATRIRFLIWHETHADFVTPWLRIALLPPNSNPSSPDGTHP